MQKIEAFLRKTKYEPKIGHMAVMQGGLKIPFILFISFVIMYFILVCSRIYQAAKLFMFSPSSGLYSCPLAMTDGAARTIEVQHYINIIVSIYFCHF